MDGVSVVLARAASGLSAGDGRRAPGPVDELLARRAREWARAAFPHAPVRCVDGDLADAGAEVLARPPASEGERVVIVAPELATWRPEVGEDAVDDLRAGCALSFGPVFDGGLYLLALSTAARGPLREATDLDLGGRAAMAGLVALAERAGLQVGMLRTERGVRRAGDVRALLVDPLCDAQLRALLG